MSRGNKSGKKPWYWLISWFKICAGVLIALILLRAAGLEILVEVELDDEPLLAKLTELETWLLPLGLVFVYLLLAWLWDRLFGSRGD